MVKIARLDLDSHGEGNTNVETLSLSALQTSRSILVTALDSLSDHQLTASIEGKSTPIGEILLHIAAVEFLITGVLAKSDNASIDTAIWRDLKPGFARELGLPSERKALVKPRIAQALEVVRALSSTIVPSAKKVNIDEIDDFLSTLPSSGAAEIEKINTALVETCEVHGGLAAPPWVIILSHESYHRGQILLLRHQVGQ